MNQEDKLMAALRQVIDPEIGKNIVELGMVRDLCIDENGKVSFTLALTTPKCPLKNQLSSESRKALMAVDGVKEVQITFGELSEAEKQALFNKNKPQLPSLAQFNQIGRIIAVMSGKGGVGKSSVSAMLASELQKAGEKVGILDADLTGPSIPKLFGLPPGGLRGNEQGILPSVTNSGIKVVSVNLLLEEEDVPVIWRGPIISGTINQFWNQTIWGRLDTLIVDLPPGTSDATLTVLQSIPLTGVLMVTTPQQLVSMVVRKGVRMVQQLNIPIIGLVENMSYFQCPDDGKIFPIFGESHAEEIANLAGAPVFVRLPVNPQISTLCDNGQVEEVNLPEMEKLVKLISQTAFASSKN